MNKLFIIVSIILASYISWNLLQDATASLLGLEYERDALIEFHSK